MLGHRSVSVGDVIAVDTGAHTHWLACDPFGWRPISEPAPTNLSGKPLSGRDLVEGDHLAFADGHLLRDLRPVIEGSGVQWLLVDRVLVDGTAHPGRPPARPAGAVPACR